MAKKKGRGRRDSMRMDHRRTKATELYIQGLSITQIADELGVTRQTIHTDIKSVREEWQRDRIFGMNMFKQRELEIIDRIADEAWLSWKKSLLESVSIKENIVSGSEDEPAIVTASERTRKGQCGNPAFLQTMLQCSADRRKVLGLDAPTKVAPTTPEGDEPYVVALKEIEKRAEGMSDEQLKAAAKLRTIFDPSATNLN